MKYRFTPSQKFTKKFLSQSFKKSQCSIPTASSTGELSNLQKIPFVFKVMKPSWVSSVKQKTQDRILEEGLFSNKLKPYVNKVLAVQQSCTGVQITLADDLSVTPHGQFYGKLPSYGDVPVEVVTNVDKLTSNGGPVQTMVVNDKTLEATFIHAIGFLRTKGKHKRDKKRQSDFIDLGFTDGQSHTQASTELGTMIPDYCTHTIDKNTNEPDEFVQKLFVNCSNALKKYFPCIWEGRDSNRLEFPKYIHKNNIIETIRVAMTFFNGNKEDTEKGLCNLHVDRSNDAKFSQVIVFSNVVWKEKGVSGWRVSFIMYTRHSVHTCLNREEVTHGPNIQMILDFLNEMDEKHPYRTKPERMVEYINSVDKTGTSFGFDYNDFPCHMMPEIYMSPLIGSIAKLNCKFDLTYPEVVSILRACGGLPNTTHYVSIILLNYIRANKLPTRGIMLGRTVYQHALEIYLKRIGKVISYRFPNYNSIRFFSEEEWKESVETMVEAGLNSFVGDEKVKSKKVQEKKYKEALQKWISVLPGVEYLAGNHLLGIAAILGIFPFYFTELYYTTSSKGFDFFGQKGDAIQVFLKAIVRAVQIQRNEVITIRQAENIVCKCFRHLVAKEKELKKNLGKETTETKEKFSDHHIRTLPFIYLDTTNNTTIIEYTDGRKYVIEGSIFKKWFFDKKWLPLEDFLHQKPISNLLRDACKFVIHPTLLEIPKTKYEHEHGSCF